ncbi:efflux RND transporter periplasmic adaptor subunit [Allokutzneria albata]|uniref:Membrane fusion protein, macrolide-specific efflux system n=1 Tax=Allokutzneria albata TaxID=211114 RepID=A0A1G9Z9U9_ALLAB|nr:HlyD family efflux transporter periplasmic adaptor subunit [Allokutzneria albata]SDN18149.1 membrane fusion protein, macrolide-specific efflux system [Allokutzneria albata]
MRRAVLINTGLIVIVLVAGFFTVRLLFPGQAAQGAAPRTVPVTTGSVSATVSAAGTVQSASTVGVNFGTNGTVKKISVKVGDKVSAGQELARLDTTALQSKVDQADASLDAAEASLAAVKSDDAATLAQRKSQVTQAKAALTEAKANLAAAVLKAPAEGTVVSISGSVGNPATSGSSGGGSSGGSSSSSSSSSGNAASNTTSGFIVLSDLVNFQVKANIAEIDISRLKAGQDATVTINALPDKQFPAKVNQIDLTPTTSGNVVQYGVTLNLDQVPDGLKPGQSASVQVVVAKVDNALTVPSFAVQSTGGTHRVTVWSNGQQTLRTVQVGVKGEQSTQITSGLTEGELVVIPTATANSTQQQQQLPGGRVTFGGGGGGGGGFVGGGGGPGGNR